MIREHMGIVNDKLVNVHHLYMVFNSDDSSLQKPANICACAAPVMCSQSISFLSLEIPALERNPPCIDFRVDSQYPGDEWYDFPMRLYMYYIYRNVHHLPVQ